MAANIWCISRYNRYTAMRRKLKFTIFNVFIYTSYDSKTLNIMVD